MVKGERAFDKGWDQFTKKGNYEKGMKFMRKAAGAGNRAAVLFLAELAHTGSLSVVINGAEVVFPVEKDIPLALELYAKLPQCAAVCYIQALAYYYGDETEEDSSRAYALFSRISKGECEPDFPEISLLYDFEFAGEKEEADGEIRRRAAMYAAVMTYYGDGVDENKRHAFTGLMLQEEIRRKENIPMQEFWLPEHIFVLERLKLEFEDQPQYTQDDFNRLFWVLDNIEGLENKRIVAEELMMPPLYLKLQEAAENKNLNDIRMCLRILEILKSEKEYSDAYALILAGDALDVCGEDGAPNEDNLAICWDCLTLLSKTFNSLMGSVLLAEFSLRGLKHAKWNTQEYLTLALRQIPIQYRQYAAGDVPAELPRQIVAEYLQAARTFLKENEDLATFAAPKDFAAAKNQIAALERGQTGYFEMPERPQRHAQEEP